MPAPPHPSPIPPSPLPSRGVPRTGRWPLTLLFLLGLPLVLGAAAAEEPAPKKRAPTFEELFGDTVIVRGRNLEIKQSQLDKSFQAYRANLAAKGKRLPESQRALREAVLLDQMIATFLLTNRATKTDYALAVTEAEQFYTETRKAAGSDENFVLQLKLTGLTPEQYNLRLIEKAAADAVLDRELKSTFAVTEAEIQAFYQSGTDERVRALQRALDEEKAKAKPSPKDLATILEGMETVQSNNLAQLSTPETVKVIHLLVSTRIPDRDEPLPDAKRSEKRVQAEALLKRVRNGDNFENLVRLFSEDRRLAESGGIYEFSREDPYATEFKAASFSLNPGQVSDLVTTTFGYHIIKCLEKIPAKKRPLDEVKGNIQALLVRQQLRARLPDYLKKLKAEAQVQILESKYILKGPAEVEDPE